MKSKHIISLYIYLAGLCYKATSCEEMMTPDIELYNLGIIRSCRTAPIDR